MTHTIDTKQFRMALGSFTTGVTIVTAHGADGKDAGLTANSFNSVSLDPPMVLWSLGKKSSNFRAFIESNYFAVHILAFDQEQLSNQFSKSGIDRFAGLSVGRGVGDVPLLDGCSARFECRTTVRHDSGDHVIVVGEVLSFDSFKRPPLVFHGGKYGLLLKKVDADLDATSNLGDEWLGFLLRRAYYQHLMPLRNDVQSRGLGNVHLSILSILGMGDGRSVSELSSLLDLTGHQATQSHFQELAKQNLVELWDAEDGKHVRFTAQGRKYAIDLMVAEKAAEGDATRGLDYQEVRLLKSLLRRIIRNTEADLPAHWRREKVWRENNIWSASG
jgi:3-hydroxy-9,10-secoandrosta-1,3,5(10)-triene-9,17-dione monooxygenase reductase component